MMTTADMVRSIVARTPDTNGSFRFVWFEDGFVVKMDAPSVVNNRAGCASEFENSQFMNDFAFFYGDRTWEIKFPKVDMVGEYLIMQRIDLGGRHGFGCDCPIDNSVPGCYIVHSEDCAYITMEFAICLLCNERYGLYDIHPDNYKIDEENRIVWIIDFAN